MQQFQVAFFQATAAKRAETVVDEHSLMSGRVSNVGSFLRWVFPHCDARTMDLYADIGPWPGQHHQPASTSLGEAFFLSFWMLKCV